MGDISTKIQKFIEIFIDNNGYVKVVEGLKNTVIIAIAGLIIGILIGGISGYFGGWVDTILMRVVDVVICIPAMPLYIIIGSVNFTRIEHGPFSHATIGYKMDRDYQNMGYTKEACKAAIAVIFSNYKIHRIEARVAPDNTASIHVLEHLGFVYEGIEYQGVEVNGAFQDHYRYSLLQSATHC